MASFVYATFVAGLLPVETPPGLPTQHQDQMTVQYSDGHTQTFQGAPSALLNGLNTLGALGWEFVGEVHYSQGGGQYGFMGILKMQTPAQSTPFSQPKRSR